MSDLPKLMTREELEQSWCNLCDDLGRLTKENADLVLADDYKGRKIKELADENEALKAENKTLRQKNDNWLERCEGLNTEVVDHQFQNDCHSGSEICACSKKNGYPCYRHIDHEYRKLFAINTLTIDRAEKAESERYRLREALLQITVNRFGSETVCNTPDNRATCGAIQRAIKALNHKEGL